MSKPIIVSGITIDGADAGNYTLLDTSTTTTATISAKTLTGTVTVASKQYDETDSATISSRDLSGVVSGDNVQYIGGTATFADIHVGVNIPVTAEGLSLAGADAANYTVNTTATTTADITVRTLTITPKPVTKTYGETVIFTGASTEYGAVGLLPDDSITSLTITSTGGPASAGVAGSPYAIVASNASGIGLDDYDIQYVNGSLTVNPVVLTVTGVAAAGKVYDATTTATIDTTEASLVGVIEGDGVFLNSTGKSGAFDTKDVGAGKTVTVSGLTLTGTAAGNYVLTQPTTTATITAKALIGSVTVFPKTWDGTTSATIATRTLNGVYAGDVVSYVGGNANFDTPEYGTDKPVTATGLSLSGADAGNYTVNDTAYTTGEITALYVLRLTALPQTKVYGQTFAFDQTMFAAAGLQEGDSVTVTLSSLGANSTASVTSSPYTITVSDAVITGPGAGGYQFVYVSGELTVTQKSITVTGVTAGNKSYDGNTTAALVTGSAQLLGVINDDQVVLFPDEGSGQFADKNVGNNKLVTIAGLALDGQDAGNYALTQPTTTANITAKDLTVIGAIANDKVYDRTTAATIATELAELSGVVAGDDVSLGKADVSGVFADWNVGTSKLVTISGFTTSGTDASNYTLTQPTSSASITSKGLLVTPEGDNKVYDGTTSATVTLTDDRIEGDIFTTDYSVAGFTDRNVGNGKLIYVSGISIAGQDASNYTLLTTVNSTTANITPKPLTGSITVLDKVYDETDAATIATASLSGVVTGDDVAYVLDVGGTVTFASIGVGTGIEVTATGMTLTGSDAGNYTVNPTATTTADINPAPLTITPNNQSKTYGTFFTFIGTEFTAVGLLGDDTVTSVTLACAGTPANAHVSATPYAILASNAVGDGLDDYTINYAAGQFTVDPKSLTVTATGQNKVYDATDIATVTLSTDHVAGDSVTAAYTTATFSDKNAGTGKTVTVSGITIDGADAENYVLADPTTTTTADITTRDLTVTATGNDRDYDGTTGATVNLLTDKLTGDAVTATYTSATFADKNVGTDKTVVVTGIAILGDDADNYALNDTSTTTTATISAKVLAGQHHRREQAV